MRDCQHVHIKTLGETPYYTLLFVLHSRELAVYYSLLSLLHILKCNFTAVCTFKVAFCCSCFRLTRLFIDAQTVLSYSGNRSFSGFQDLMESVQRLGERPGAWPSTTFKSSYSTHLKIVLCLTVWHSDTETHPVYIYRHLLTNNYYNFLSPTQEWLYQTTDFIIPSVINELQIKHTEY